MKVTKTFISVFLLTFLIGVSVVPTGKIEKPIETPEKLSRRIPLPQSETRPALETIEEVDNRLNIEKYPFKIKLLETGEGYHGHQVEAKSGEVWLGLFKENDNYYLRSTKLKIRRVYDYFYDEDKSKKTGKDIIVESKNPPVFLLKDTRAIREGQITTFFQGQSWDEAYSEEADLPPEDILTTLKKGFAQEFESSGKTYELKVIKARNKDDEKIWALTLESEDIRQILHTIKDEDNFHLGHLFWVGDLDRDGKPDFYFDLFEHYNAINRVLFLSSPAEKSKLVKKAAYFWTSGCA